MKLNVIDETDVETCIMSAIVQFGKGNAELINDIVRYAAEYFDADLFNEVFNLRQENEELFQKYEDIKSSHDGLEYDLEEVNNNFVEYRNIVNTFIQDIEDL